VHRAENAATTTRHTRVPTKRAAGYSHLLPAPPKAKIENHKKNRKATQAETEEVSFLFFTRKIHRATSKTNKITV
jgi:hypothetical protein